MSARTGSRSTPLVKCGVVHVHVSHFDGGPQWSASIPVDNVDIGALFDQEAGRFHVIVGDRHQQRCDAIRIRLLQIRAGSNQDFGGFGAAITRGIQQREKDRPESDTAIRDPAILHE